MPRKGTKLQKKRKCHVGYPCKMGCISVKKNCRAPLRWQAETFAKWLKLQEERFAVTNQKRAKAGLSPATMNDMGYISAQRIKVTPKTAIATSPSISKVIDEQIAQVKKGDILRGDDFRVQYRKDLDSYHVGMGMFEGTQEKLLKEPELKDFLVTKDPSKIRITKHKFEPVTTDPNPDVLSDDELKTAKNIMEGIKNEYDLNVVKVNLDNANKQVEQWFPTKDRYEYDNTVYLAGLKHQKVFKKALELFQSKNTARSTKTNTSQAIAKSTTPSTKPKSPKGSQKKGNQRKDSQAINKKEFSKTDGKAPPGFFEDTFPVEIDGKEYRVALNEMRDGAPLEEDYMFGFIQHKPTDERNRFEKRYTEYLIEPTDKTMKMTGLYHVYEKDEKGEWRPHVFDTFPTEYGSLMVLDEDEEFRAKLKKAVKEQLPAINSKILGGDFRKLKPIFLIRKRTEGSLPKDLSEHMDRFVAEIRKVADKRPDIIADVVKKLGGNDGAETVYLKNVIQKKLSPLSPETMQSPEAIVQRVVESIDKRNAKGSVVTGVAIPPGYGKEEQSTLKTAHLKNLYGLAMGEQDTRSPSMIAKQDAVLFDSNNEDPSQAPKIEKLKEDGLTEPEAHGVAAWIGCKFSPINREIYAPTGSDYGEGAGIRARQGLHKLKSYTQKEMESLSKKAGDDLLPDGQLIRGISDIPDVDAFLKPYRDAVGKGEFKEPSFFATTAKSNLWATSDAQIQYVVTPRADGTGQGKMIDRYKNGNFEGEVLYPPYSRFKVTKVEDGGVEYKVPRDFMLTSFVLPNLPTKYEGVQLDGLEPLIPQMLKEKELLKAFSDESFALEKAKKLKSSDKNDKQVKLKEKKVGEIKRELKKMGYDDITDEEASKYFNVFEFAISPRQKPFKIYMEEL